VAKRKNFLHGLWRIFKPALPARSLVTVLTEKLGKKRNPTKRNVIK
jgi:hypothetical protein